MQLLFSFFYFCIRCKATLLIFVVRYLIISHCFFLSLSLSLIHEMLNKSSVAQQKRSKCIKAAENMMRQRLPPLLDIIWNYTKEHLCKAHTIHSHTQTRTQTRAHAEQSNNRHASFQLVGKMKMREKRVCGWSSNQIWQYRNATMTRPPHNMTLQLYYSKSANYSSETRIHWISRH